MKKIKLVKYCTRTTELYNSQAGERQSGGSLEWTQAFYPLSIVNFCNSLAGCGRLGGNCDHDGSQLVLRKGLKMQWPAHNTRLCISKISFDLITKLLAMAWSTEDKLLHAVFSIVLTAGNSYRSFRRPSLKVVFNTFILKEKARCLGCISFNFWWLQLMHYHVRWPLSQGGIAPLHSNTGHLRSLFFSTNNNLSSGCLCSEKSHHSYHQATIFGLNEVPCGSFFHHRWLGPHFLKH